MTTDWIFVVVGVAVGSLAADLLYIAIRGRRIVTCADCGVQVSRDKAREVLLDYGHPVSPTRLWYCDRHGASWEALRDPGMAMDAPRAVRVDMMARCVARPRRPQQMPKAPPP